MDDIGFADQRKNRIRNFSKKTNKKYMLPIFSAKGGEYQMDTLENSGGKPPYFLIFININSRMGYAFPMSNKGGESVFNAFKQFYSQTGDVKIITCDQDPAYTTYQMEEFFNKNGIKMYRTMDNDHNKLGIINRFIKTLRDMNHKPTFDKERMAYCIKLYNNHKHRGTGKAPNEFTSKDEINYIRKKWQQTQAIRSIRPNYIGQRVRILDERNPTMYKKRYNYEPEYVTVSGYSGNQAQVYSGNGNVEKYPLYKLKLDNNPQVLEKFSLHNNKFGEVQEIRSFNKKNKMYNLKYTDGTSDWVHPSALRLDKPFEQTEMEKEFWKKPTYSRKGPKRKKKD